MLVQLSGELSEDGKVLTVTATTQLLSKAL
jgi:hypothetical protein